MSSNDNRDMYRMFDFFDRLAANNDRVWFKEHKSEYDALRAEWIEGMGRIIALVAQQWPEVRYLDPARATYRIYRDIRFSNDKTPYKSFLSSSIAPPQFAKGHVGIYLQAGHNADDTGIYGGIWCPDAAAQRKLRRAIADNSEEWLEIVDNPDLVDIYGRDWVGARLKTAPKGYDRDDPMIEYLRLKDIGKFTNLSRQVFRDPAWPEHIAALMAPLVPLCRFIAYSLEENV